MCDLELALKVAGKTVIYNGVLIVKDGKKVEQDG